MVWTATCACRALRRSRRGRRIPASAIFMTSRLLLNGSRTPAYPTTLAVSPVSSPLSRRATTRASRAPAARAAKSSAVAGRKPHIEIDSVRTVRNRPSGSRASIAGERPVVLARGRPRGSRSGSCRRTRAAAAARLPPRTAPASASPTSRQSARLGSPRQIGTISTSAGAAPGEREAAPRGSARGRGPRHPPRATGRARAGARRAAGSRGTSPSGVRQASEGSSAAGAPRPGVVRAGMTHDRRDPETRIDGAGDRSRSRRSPRGARSRRRQVRPAPRAADTSARPSRAASDRAS